MYINFSVYKNELATIGFDIVRLIYFFLIIDVLCRFHRISRRSEAFQFFLLEIGMSVKKIEMYTYSKM